MDKHFWLDAALFFGVFAPLVVSLLNPDGYFWTAFKWAVGL